MQVIIILETFKDFFSCKMSWPQIIFILQLFKNFLACKIVLDANHHYPENIQIFYRLQNCLSRKSFLSWNYSKTFSPAKMSETQIIIILKKFRDFLACKIVLDANHLYPENIQRFYRLQNCLSRKSFLSWNYSKTFRLQKCLRRKSFLSWNYSKNLSPAKLS